MLPTNATYPNKVSPAPQALPPTYLPTDLSTNLSTYLQDKDGNPLETEYGLSTYKDHQSITIQEMPERAPLGQMPRSINLIFEYDLVDKVCISILSTYLPTYLDLSCIYLHHHHQVKPGDRIQCMGIYKALAGVANGQTSGVFQTVVLVNNVRQIGKDNASLKMSAEDIGHIKNCKFSLSIIMVNLPTYSD